MKIVYLDSFALNPGDLDWASLKTLGSVELYDNTAPEQVPERLKDAEVAIVNKVELREELFTQLPELKLIAVTATGVNNVDIDAAKKFGITVCNVPAYSTMSVVQMVFAHILQFTNNVAGHAASVAGGEWEKSDLFCYWNSQQIELAHKTIGIIGYGNIGRALAKVAFAFDMNVKVYSRTKRPDTQTVSFVSKEELLRESDIVVLCCALTDDTKEIINESSLNLMKKSALLINTGRGPLINEGELAAALNGGGIAGAGLDVLTQEPPRDGSPLIGAKNSYITPHIAWATLEARARALDITVENIKAYIADVPQNVVTQ